VVFPLFDQATLGFNEVGEEKSQRGHAGARRNEQVLNGLSFLRVQMTNICRLESRKCWGEIAIDYNVTYDSLFIPALGIKLSPPTPQQGTWELFLSSTIADLHKYRVSVESELRKRQVACFLSERDWPTGFERISDLCRNNVQRASGYALLLGHWYGWIPPSSPEKKSITHLEFCWAVEKWKQNLNKAPIRVYSPQPGSAADTELLSAAKLGLKGKKREEQQMNKAGIQNFRDYLSKLERVPILFKTRKRLAENLVIDCCVWKNLTFEAAACGLAPVERSARLRQKLSDEVLGRLGRSKHMQALETALLSLDGADKAPGACVLIYGGEFAGQSEFVSWVLAERKLPGRTSDKGQPPVDLDAGLLPSWVEAELGLKEPGGQEVQTPEDLAGRIAAELQSQALYFVLDEVQRLPGGVAAFHERFWLPLYKRLQELRKQTGFKHKLRVLLVDYGGVAPASQLVCGPDFESEEPDYNKVLLLPELKQFTQVQVKQWLAAEGVAEENIEALSKLAVCNTEGESDGTPIHVFRRLCHLDLKMKESLG